MSSRAATAVALSRRGRHVGQRQVFAGARRAVAGAARRVDGRRRFRLAHRLDASRQRSDWQSGDSACAKRTCCGSGRRSAAAEAEAIIEATLRRGALGLVEVARQARLAENEKLLVVVDQFEEMFRFAPPAQLRAPAKTRRLSSNCCSKRRNSSELSIYIVLTMRSDFLGDCAQFQGLPEAINDGQYLIPRMTRDERRLAITGPVAVARGKITEPLVNRLLNDVGDNPDQLPILQHALMRTWDHWAAHRRNGEPIDLDITKPSARWPKRCRVTPMKRIPNCQTNAAA